MSRAQWVERPERGSEWWLHVMLRVTNFVGRPIARWLLWPIAGFFWLRTSQARADSARYLSRVLGRPVTARDTFRHYLTFSSTILDRVFFLSGRQSLFDVQVVGEQCLTQALAAGQGVLLVGAHLGSMESLRSIGHVATERRVSMAMFEQNAARIGRFLRAIDPALEQDIVPLGQSGSMLVLHERLQEGGIVGLLADRSFGHEAGIVVPFLGYPASFPTGVFKMASILRCPVVTMAGLYLGQNRYQLHFVPLADFTGAGRGTARRQAIEQAVADYARQLEAFCHAAPYNWFNFYDFWALPDAQADAVATAGGRETP